ncbi:MAG: site-specific DNA-methyltransferase [Phycisphaerales bacterium]|nr:site-specific DNA-methyltransferase [Phycisphaerales bacterium]
MIELDRVHRMDAFEGLSRLPDESVDLVLTDPPYNIASAGRTTIVRGQIMSTQKAWGSWDSLDAAAYDAMIQRLVAECYRVLKPGGSFYMFSAREQNGVFIRYAEQCGFSYRNQLAIVKTTPLPSMAKKNWRSAFELCLYVVKGTDSRPGMPGTFNFVSQKELVNVYYHPSCAKVTRHPTEKPFEMMKRIVRVSSNPGDLVLDPFMGSGTTAAACVETGRRFVGFETNPEYIKMANGRILAGRKAA